MRNKTNFYYRNLFLVLSVISILLLTACGGGAPKLQTASNVTVTVSGSLITSSSIRTSESGNSSKNLKLTVVAFSNGKEKTDIKIDDRYLTMNGTDYSANITLLNVYDYKFIVAYKDTPILSNQISVNELSNGKVFPVDIDTTVRALAYDAWLDKNPENASVKNFTENCNEVGLLEAHDFYELCDDYFYYEDKISSIIKGEENISLPTKSDIKIATINTDNLESKIQSLDFSDQDLIGIWYLHINNGDYCEPYPNGDCDSIEFKKDYTFTQIHYYDEQYASIKADVKSKTNLRFSEQPRFKNIATGTWKFDSGKLQMKFGDDGNKEKTLKINISNDTLTMIQFYNNGRRVYTYENIYKKTKPEMLKINEDFVGTWYLNYENETPVIPNSKGEVDTIIFGADRSYTRSTYFFTESEEHPDYIETDEEGWTNYGKWGYWDGKIITNFNGSVDSFSPTQANNELIITETYGDETWRYTYKKTKYSK